MKKIRLGMVGLGNMGGGHAACYNEEDRVEIVAMCDLIPSKPEVAIKNLNLSGVKVYTDFREMIDKEELDAVDICTPNDFHSIIAVYALEHGLHVFCEKPDAMNVEEVLKMKSAAEKSGKTLMVMRNNRYYEPSKIIKKYIEDGKMGEIYCGRCGWVRRRGMPGKGGWFTTKAKSGGGPLIDLGVHMIDLSMWLMGNPKPVSVMAGAYAKFADNDAESDSEHANFGEKNADGVIDTEDLVMGFIRFDNGAVLQIEFSWASNIKQERKFVELRGTKAGFTLADNSFLEVYSEEDGKLTTDIVSNYNDDCGDGHHRNITHFLDVICDGKKPDFVPDQGVDMIKFLAALYKSAETGHEVIL